MVTSMCLRCACVTVAHAESIEDETLGSSFYVHKEVCKDAWCVLDLVALPRHRLEMAENGGSSLEQ